MVKNFMRSGNVEGHEDIDFYGRRRTPWKLITNKPITASAAEVEANPRVVRPNCVSPNASPSINVHLYPSRRNNHNTHIQIHQSMSRKDGQPSYTTPLGYVRRVTHGQVISAEFFRRHWGITALVVLFLLLYITNKYYCQTSMEEIRALNKELELVKTERIRAKSIYMSRTRESAMQVLIDSLDLGLGVQTRPRLKSSKTNFPPSRTNEKVRQTHHPPPLCRGHSVDTSFFGNHNVESA